VGRKQEDYRRAGTDEPPDELRISPLKDVKLLKAAKTDMVQLAAKILKGASDASHRWET
jgi:hypothetical protein